MLLLFGTLTVTVDDRALSFRFGIGAIRRRIPLASIVSWQQVRNSWWYGWGIRFYPGGMLYNVSGLSAVELLLANGTRLRVGTDQPALVAEALTRRRGSPPAFDDAVARAGARPARRWLWVIVAVNVVILGAVVSGVLVQRRPPIVFVADGELSISAGYSATIPLSSITAVSLESTLPPVRRRTNGFALGQTLRGHFLLDGLGRGQLFVERDQSPYVLIRTGDGFVFVNFDDPSRTRALHTDLVAAFERSRR